MAEWGPMLIILFFSIVVHEYAHGAVAYRCGDSTAFYAGRLTLNPLPHIDLFGTIVFPGLLILSGSPFLFGWAKPVPVNPFNLRHPRWDSVKVSAAGPASNLLLAAAATILWISAGLLLTPGIQGQIDQYLNFALQINVLLAVFNMIPIPPLDGSHILEYFLSPQAQLYYDKVKQYGFIILLLFIMTPLFSIIHYISGFIVSIYKIVIYYFLY